MRVLPSIGCTAPVFSKPIARTCMQVPLNDLRRVHAPHASALRAAYERVFSRGSFVLGDEVRAFEQEFAAYCGTRECVGVANGSDALEIALRALGVSAGDRVATVANAAMYSTLAIRATGARPVYVDVDEATLTMSPAALEALPSGTLHALVVTHLYGRLADTGPIVAYARERGVPVIEDCAQAHGAERDGTRAGAFGSLATFSFYPTKNLGALGDGGAITTSDAALADTVRELRQYGWRGKYRVDREGGRNSRLDELQAAFLRAKLPSLDRENARRRDIVNRYANGIRHPDIRSPLPAGSESVAHLAVIRTPHREALRAHLSERGVATDVHYPIADHRQRVANAADVKLPVSERACGEVLSLPCFPAITDAEADAVIEACNAWRR
jgi:dTDP-4-amino-4,6-dideoxygalactose transaminase